MRHITLVILSFVSLSLHAVSFTLPFSNDPEFLPVEQAFQFNFSPGDDNQVALVWDIADGYYLYQHQFKVQETSTTNSQVRLASLPLGKEKHDPYFGDVIVYRDQLKTSLIYDSLAVGTIIKANVQYQGCADKGLCYPPQTLPIQFVVSTQTQSDANVQSNTTENIQTQNNNATIALPAPSQANYVMGVLQQGDIFTVMLTLFGLGLLLSLTPCVLPMIPIVSAIVVGNQSNTASPTTHAAWRGFYYSALYVLAMASTYAGLGALAGYFGTQVNLQAYLQNPIILAVSALIFILLALAMFGVYELTLPSAWQNRLSKLGNNNSKQKSLSVVITGVLATLIVSPCVSAPLAGVILFISTQGDVAYGAIMLFVMALGMGVPLLLVGIFGAKILPKSGEWLNDIKVIMGFALLAIAIWLLGRWHITSYQLYFWSLFFILFSAYFFTRYRVNPNNPIRLGLGIFLLTFGVLQAVGAATGGTNPITPLSKLRGSFDNQRTHEELNFNIVYSLADLEKVITSNHTGKPILLDLYADWCISCKVIEEEIFLAQDVFPLLEQFVLVKADVTDNSFENQQLMNHYQLYGPPSLLFFFANGETIKTMTLIGEPSKKEVIERLTYILQTTSKQNEI